MAARLLRWLTGNAAGADLFENELEQWSMDTVINRLQLGLKQAHPLSHPKKSR